MAAAPPPRQPTFFTRVTGWLVRGTPVVRAWGRVAQKCETRNNRVLKPLYNEGRVLMPTFRNRFSKADVSKVQEGRRDKRQGRQRGCGRKRIRNKEKGGQMIRIKVRLRK